MKDGFERRQPILEEIKRRLDEKMTVGRMIELPWNLKLTFDLVRAYDSIKSAVAIIRGRGSWWQRKVKPILSFASWIILALAKFYVKKV